MNTFGDLYWNFWIILGDFVSSTGLIGHLFFILIAVFLFMSGMLFSSWKTRKTLDIQKRQHFFAIESTLQIIATWLENNLTEEQGENLSNYMERAHKELHRKVETVYENLQRS